MPVQQIVKIAAMLGKTPAKVATTVPIETASTTFFTASVSWVISAVPGP
jgi:hypothetical protein